MPKRTPGQPERFMDRYRTRLDEEMKAQGETDRSLSDKLAEAGYSVSFSSIYKTRTGTRQPAMDECYEVARVLGYPNLDYFLDGPMFIRIARAAGKVARETALGWLEVRSRVTEALYELDDAVRDPKSAAAADIDNPAWRQEFYSGIERDIRWTMREQAALAEETLRRLAEIFSDTTAEPDAGTVEEMHKQKITGRGAV